MWWKKPNELQKRVKELLNTMTPDEAVRFCLLKEVETRHKAEEISKRYQDEYLQNRKQQDEWKKLADFIINSKQNIK